MNAIREHLEVALGKQVRHPVHPLIEVLWSEGCDLTRCTMRVGTVTEEVPPEVVVKRVFQRNRLIERETKDPLRYACEPDIWRQIDLEICKKRLALPGMVLEVLVTGGIRAGKTEGATRRVNAIRLGMGPKRMRQFANGLLGAADLLEKEMGEALVGAVKERQEKLAAVNVAEA